MKLFLISHGKFCEGLLDSYQMIAGESQDIFTLSLTDAGIQDFSDGLTGMLAKREKEDVLILTDIKGGTPYNEAYKQYLLDQEHIGVVAGMNLPMVIEVGLNLSNKSLIELVEMAIEIGRGGIQGVTEESSMENDLEF